METQTTSQKASAANNKRKRSFEIDDTLAVIRILIDDRNLSQSEIPPRGSKPAMTIYSQPAVLTAGEKTRPLHYQHSFFDKSDQLPAGVYIYPSNAFKLDSYGKPTLDPYCKLVYIDDLSPEQSAMFSSVKTDMSDIL